MLKKCMKYDLRSFFKIWLIAAIVMLFISIIGGIGLGSFLGAIPEMEEMDTESSENLLPMILIIARMIIGIFSYIAVIYSLIIFASGTSIMLYIRYYTHFFTDQGYLTFTLPVRRSTLFWSKTLSALIYTVGSMLVTAISIFNVGACIVISLALNPQIAAEFGLDLPAMLSGLQFSTVAYALVLLVLCVIFIVALTFASLMMQYLIITIAATLFRKLKLLSVILSYYLINNIIAVPIMYIGIYYVMFAVMFLAMGLMTLFAIPILAWLGIYLLILIASVACVAVGLIFANFTVQRLERKLNLA